MMTRTRLIFDAALELEPGEQMVVKCHSFKQMESLRVSLYRERVAWSDRSQDAEEIMVTSDKKNMMLVIEKVKKVAPPVVIGPDGEIKRIVPLKRTLSLPDDKTVEVSFKKDPERIASMMRADGYSEEEIQRYLEE